LINALKPLIQPASKSLSALRNWLEKSRRRMQQRGSITLNVQSHSLRESLAGSLRRLGRDQLDIFLLHDPSPQ
jgi:aryl-alcohol dehydrogenase-like predicted oxidoreductase